MQMLCKVSDAFSDVCCPVCEQGFLVYWTRMGAGSREEQRQGLLDGLRLQHGDGAMNDAHPAVFHLAEAISISAFGDAAAIGIPSLLGVYS